jgi:hypothetical protein
MCVDAPYGMAIQLTSGCQSIDSLKGRLVFQLMHWKLNAKLHNGIASAHKFQSDKELLFKSWLGSTTLHIFLEEQEKVKNSKTLVDKLAMFLKIERYIIYIFIICIIRYETKPFITSI